eukprot:scaffold22902_cov21-Tisochrysis_lutea.AAC.1
MVIELAVLLLGPRADLFHKYRLPGTNATSKHAAPSIMGKFPRTFSNKKTEHTLAKEKGHEMQGAKKRDRKQRQGKKGRQGQSSRKQGMQGQRICFSKHNSQPFNVGQSISNPSSR